MKGGGCRESDGVVRGRARRCCGQATARGLEKGRGREGARGDGYGAATAGDCDNAVGMMSWMQADDTTAMLR